MSFHINISFLLALKFGRTDADAIALAQEIGEVEDKSTPHPTASFRPLTPAPEPEDQVAVTPVKPRLHRSYRRHRHLQRKGASSTPSPCNMVDASIFESPAAKAEDRESLEILLRSTSKLRQPTCDGSQQGTPVSPQGHSISSSDELIKVTFPNTVPTQSSVSSQSLVGSSGSSSALVLSLQRLRVGELASYFERLDKSAGAHSSCSRAPAALASVPKHNIQGLSQVGMEDEDWEKLSVADASD